MPKLDPKAVQRELEAGTLWPVYWLYGQERMKSRELLKRIRKAVFGEANGLAGLGEESLEGGDTAAGQVIDAAQSLALGGGLRLIVVKDAHLISDPEDMSCLLGPSAKRESLSSVCVFLSKDLDGRKKFSKMLQEKAAVVSCEEIAEEDREPWIAYLAKKRGLTLDPGVVLQLRSVDPWSLDIVDQELEKFALSDSTPDVLLGSVSGPGQGTESFLDAFFGRNRAQAMLFVETLAESPEESLPLLGLLAWNVRHLAITVTDRARGTSSLRLSPFVVDRFNRWSRRWQLDEVLSLQKALSELDFGLKQTPRLPLGLWADLVSRFCL